MPGDFYYQCVGPSCRKVWSLEELDAEMTTPYTCPECGQHVKLLAAGVVCKCDEITDGQTCPRHGKKET